MFYASIAVIPHQTTHFAKRLTRPFSRPNLFRAARVIGPTLVALAFTGAANLAHAQGTMDFSGAQTLMSTFKTFAVLNPEFGSLDMATAREVHWTTSSG
jgi:hypothetical protein